MKLPKTKLIIIVLLLISIGAGYLYLYRINTPPTMTQINPSNDQKFVPDTQTIQVKFDQELLTSQQKKLTLTLNPTTTLKITWPTPQILEATPTSPLNPNTTYNLNVDFNQKSIFQSSFSTNLYTQTELKQQIKEQITSDYDYAQTRNGFYQTHPWVVSLPIREDRFTITYDEQDSVFRIITKQTESAEIITKIKQFATIKLLEIGVPEDQITFQVIDLSQIEQ